MDFLDRAVGRNAVHPVRPRPPSLFGSWSGPPELDEGWPEQQSPDGRRPQEPPTTGTTDRDEPALMSPARPRGAEPRTEPASWRDAEPRDAGPPDSAAREKRLDLRRSAEPQVAETGRDGSADERAVPAGRPPARTTSANTRPGWRALDSAPVAGAEQPETELHEAGPSGITRTRIDLGETRSAEIKPAESGSAETRPAGSRPAETRSAGFRPAETRSAESGPAGSKAADGRTEIHAEHPEPSPAAYTEPTTVGTPAEVHIRAEHVRHRPAGTSEAPVSRRGPAGVPQETVVHVSIGRIDVRAERPAKPAPAERPRPPAPAGLDEYLRRRDEARR